MAEILRPTVVDAEVAVAIPVNDHCTGGDRAPYPSLSASGFEHLIYALFKHRQSPLTLYDRATLMVTGADRGRDVWLTKCEQPAGLVQCKRTAGMSAPQTLREVIKYLLFAELDPKIKPGDEFTYHLAVSEDPAGTTVDFFGAPITWLSEHAAAIEGHVRTVIGQYTSFAGMDALALTPGIIERLKRLNYSLIRPADLDEMLDAAPVVRGHFFKARLVIDLDSAREMIESVFATTRAPPASPAEASDISESSLVQASKAVADWPQEIWGRHIDRPELQQLLQRISESPAGATLLVGGAGTGKSALLAELYGALGENPCARFAIKADTIDPGVASISDLSESLGIDGDLEAHLHSLAYERGLVLLIDQLDAVSEVMDQSTHRMQVLLRLATNLRAARGPDGSLLAVHIVVSSRPFEAKFDARFKQLKADDITLAPPPYERVEELLARVGIEPDKVPASLRETLRTPFALGLYVDLVRAGADPEELTSGNLLDRWLDRKLPTEPQRTPFLQFLRQLAADMTEHETLWRPAALYEPDHSPLVRTAEAVGLLRRDGDTIGFAHQSWLDDFQAKRFATGAALVEFAWARQDGLFARGTVLRGLEHLRKADTRAYEDALRLLLSDGQTRRHIRHLTTDFLASALDPSLQEIAWVEWLVCNDKPLANRAFGKIAGTWSSWRAGLLPLLPNLMQEPEHEWSAILLLASEAAQDPAGALDLIDHYWSTPEKDEAVYRLIDRAPLISERAVRRLKVIFGRLPLADWAVSHVVTTIADAGAVEQAIDIAAGWAAVQQNDRHHSLRLHDLEKVAAQAPLLFAKAFLPWFVTVASQETLADRDHEYVRSRSIPYDWKFDADQGVLTEVLRLSLTEVARADPAGAASLLDEYVGVEIDEIQSLIADSFAANPEAFRDKAYSFLLADPRRLKLGDDMLEGDDGITHHMRGWSTANLIEAITPFLGQAETSALQQAIASWQPFDPEFLTGLGRDRMKWLRYAQDERLMLFSKFPADQLDPRLRRQIAEWAKAQPKLRRTTGRAMAHFVGSPMSQEQMSKASDHDLLGMFDTANDRNKSENEFRHFLRGGMRELSRVFGALAKEEPARAMAIVRDRLRPSEHEEVAGAAIRELASVDVVDPNELRALIWHLVSKGFSSRDWRHEVAWAFDVLSDRLKGLDDGDIDLLRSWLDRDPEAIAARTISHRETRDSNRAQNEKPDQPPSALLFGRGGGFRSVPHWNFTILSAIASGLLAREAPEHDRWLSELELHVGQPEDPEVWSAILIMRWHPLWWADAHRVSRLLDTLFEKFPAAFEEADVASSLWRLRERLSVSLQTKLIRFWGGHSDKHLRQVAGEFTAAFTIVGDPPEQSATTTDMLAGDDANARIGILFGAAAGWREQDSLIRSRSHAILMQQAENAAGMEAHALSTAMEQRQRFQPDKLTRELLSALLANEELLKATTGYFFIENLEGLLLYPGYDELVLCITERMTDLALDKTQRPGIGRNDTELVSLAVTLQRSRTDLRQRAMTLYERLLDGAVYGAEEAAAVALRR